MSQPLEIADLDRVANERPCRGAVGGRGYGDVAARLPRMRGEVLEWFRAALRDPRRKWVAAAILDAKKDAAAPLVDDLLRAGMVEPNPSMNRAFVLPLRPHLDWPRAVDRLVALAEENGGDLARGGVARIAYWLGAELGEVDDASSARLERFCAESFLATEDVYARRSLLGRIAFRSPPIDDAARALRDQVIAIARAASDPYLRERLAIQLGESSGPFRSITEPLDDPE